MYLQEPATPLLKPLKRTGSKRLRQKTSEDQVAEFMALDMSLLPDEASEQTVEMRVNIWLSSKGIMQAFPGDRYSKEKSENANSILHMEHSQVDLGPYFSYHLGCSANPRFPSMSKIAKRRAQVSQFRSQAFLAVDRSQKVEKTDKKISQFGICSITEIKYPKSENKAPPQRLNSESTQESAAF